MERVPLMEVDAQEARLALARLLASETFAGSRRLSDFLSYAGTAALEGRSGLDQYEIADKVLGRPADFNPWDDAAVRKLATQLRHKLEEYYAGPGADDRVILSLPKRSYVLRFRRRDGAVSPDAESASDAEPVLAAEPELPPPALHREPAPVVAPPRQRFRGLPWLLAGAFVGAALMGMAGLALRGGEKDASASARREVVIRTAEGDLRGPTLDVAPDAVRTGLEIREGEEAVVRMRFTPDRPTQQAGVMALFDPDRFVRLGVHFKNRSLLELGTEADGRYQTPISTYAFDPLGQQGLARWLALRRAGDEYRGYLSSDGFAWRTFGPAMSLPAAGRLPQAAFYAFNGRSSNPSAPATFDQFGTALAFHGRGEGALPADAFASWEQAVDCALPVALAIRQEALEVGFAQQALGCSWYLTQPVGPGDWAFSALVDFEPVSGSSFGVTVRGERRRATLSRRDLDGHSLMFERADDADSRIPDFPGTPPVVLRLEKVGDVVRAMASRDGDRFLPVGEVRVGEIGPVRRIGVVAGIAHWTSQGSRPPARVYWVRKEPITPGMLPRGNVPRGGGT